MTKGRVLVAGSANLDFVVRAPHVPAPGETVLGHGFAMFPGGKGANQAVACARAGGAATRMLLALGDDAQALPLEASLRDAGVELHIQRTHAPTGTAFICVGDDAENAITVVPGANAELRAEHLPDLTGVDVLLLQLESPLASVGAWAKQAHASGVRVVLNTAPAPRAPLPPALLDAVDLLIVNEGELAAMTGSSGTIVERVARLRVAGVVVTLGARGCYARIGGHALLQPGFVVDAIDTTGAGDTFCGTLAAGLASRMPEEEAVRRACAASALACTRLGAQASVPARSEVEALAAAGNSAMTVSRDELGAYCGWVPSDQP
ncbi:ribokinase [Lysobacter sp. Root494]|uniref:ribokinase n=1 Tax=Lysobacter sp. Root494 TaxID=1736549 RepID=UPI0006F72F60|nr:ribokinase [Lysobacter sp. Root494]KQY54714.1 ribokinase [Lysobacter sp. Root494]